MAARRRPATAVDRSTVASPDYFLDFAFDEVRRLTAGSKLRNLTARTTIDMGLQRLADESIDYHLRQFGKTYGVEQSAMVVLDHCLLYTSPSPRD